MPLRYVNVRFILEDIKILLLASVAFVIAFSKTCIILASYLSILAIYSYIFFVTVIFKRSNKFKPAFTPKLKHVLMS